MTTVFITGIFDLLHVEHVRFLRAARAAGDRLVIGIESDSRVKRLKGQNRPVMPEADRKEMLKSLSMVDEVIILPEQFDTDAEYEKILKEVGADIYAVSENSPFMENKRKICDKVGVMLKVVHEYNPEYSTTQLIERITS